MATQEGLCFLFLDKLVPDIEGFAVRGVVTTQTHYAHLHLRQLLYSS